MKVIFKSDEPKKTYHPKLGLLVPGAEFDLPDAQAEVYIASGLLSRVEKKEKPKKNRQTNPYKSKPGIEEEAGNGNIIDG